MCVNLYYFNIFYNYLKFKMKEKWREEPSQYSNAGRQALLTSHRKHLASIHVLWAKSPTRTTGPRRMQDYLAPHSNQPLFNIVVPHFMSIIGKEHLAISSHARLTIKLINDRASVHVIQYIFISLLLFKPSPIHFLPFFFCFLKKK